METIVIITASIITMGWLIVFSFIATRVPWFCRGRGERGGKNKLLYKDSLVCLFLVS